MERGAYNGGELRYWEKKPNDERTTEESMENREKEGLKNRLGGRGRKKK